MRLITAPTERETSCDCGARFAYVPRDVTRATVPVLRPVDVALGITSAAAVGTTTVGEWRSVLLVTCPACGGRVEVGT